MRKKSNLNIILDTYPSLLWKQYHLYSVDNTGALIIIKSMLADQPDFDTSQQLHIY